MSTARRKTNMKSSKDKDICDNQNDSGFLSGTNLLSSSSIADDGCQKDDRLSPPTSHDPSSKVTTSQCLDSGVDISEQMNSLNIRPESPSPHEIVPDYDFLEKALERDDDGDTQLHIAVMGGWVELVWHITQKLPDQALLDIPNNTGRTALHLAAAAGDRRVARHILVCGGSPVARDCRGNTPLHVACSLGDLNMVVELTRQVAYSEVAEAKVPYLQSLIPGLVAADLNNYDGQTCIHLAAQTGNRQILQHLSWYGADINAKEGKCGRTALHYGVQQRDPNLVTFLVETCRASLSTETYAGLTPYQLALANDAPAIANLLVELGAQGDPLPSRFEEDQDYDDAPVYDPEGDNWKVADDLCIGNVPISSAQSVSTTGPLNCDFYL